MKMLLKLSFVFMLISACLNTVNAQTTKKEKQAAKAAAVKKMVDEHHFVFVANYVTPMRGASKALTSDYDLKVLKDTVVSFLPYFGQAYLAPTDPTEGGIKFTWTRFDYTVVTRKNGSWDITIKPKETNITQSRDVQKMILRVSTAGYASLQVLSTNRDAISFDGEIEEIKGK